MQQQVAIVGMAAVMPGAGDLRTFWRNVSQGVDAITDTPAHRWDPEFYDPAQARRVDRLYCRRGGFVDEFATFEPLRFGIMPNGVSDIDPDQLIALNVTAAAIEDAGGADSLPDPDRVGVILGRVGTLSPGQVRYSERVRTPSQIALTLRELLPDLDERVIDLIRQRLADTLGSHQPEGAIGITPNLAASRIANRFNLRGPAYTIDAACASSLVAVDHAIMELAGSRLDAVIAGGVHHAHEITFWSVFSQLQALSRNGESRPFDTAADGLLIGEGTGMVVLKRLEDAIRCDDRIYAVIRGSGVSSDGRSASMFNPASAGQLLAVQRAWASAGLDPTAPGALGLLEAHGTATPTGDVAELATLAAAFGPHRGGERPVIGSVKSMIGHTMAAAGIAGLIKTALAIHHRVLPPTLHCDSPRPEIDGTRFQPISAARPWQSDGPRRGGVSAFGFGGINAHLVVEEHAAPAAVRVPVTVTEPEPEQVLWLADADPVRLARRLERCSLDVPAVGSGGMLRDELGVPDGSCRVGIVNPTGKRLAAARRVVERGEPWHGGRDIWFTPRPLLGAGGKVAFVFPGFEGTFEPRTDDVASHFGLPKRDYVPGGLSQQGSALTETGWLLSEALSRIGVIADAVAGHSTGEWTAAVVSGQLSDETIDEISRIFSQGIGELPDHVFLSVGASAGQISPLLADYPGVLLTHDNALAQCVVNGPVEEVTRLADALRGQRVLCQVMPFRSVSHTPAFSDTVRSVVEGTASWEVCPPRMPVWSATIAAPFPEEPEQVTELIIRHMTEPVRFRQLISAMYDAGFRVFLQVGPGQLAGLVRDNLVGRDHLAMPVNVSQRPGLDQLRRVATAMWVEGGTPDLRALSPGRGAAAPRPATAEPAPPAPTSTVRVAMPAAAKGRPVRLDLSGTLLRIGPGAADLLRPTPAAAAAAPAVPVRALPVLAASARSASARSATGTASETRPADAHDTAAAHLASLAILREAGRAGVAAEIAALIEETSLNTPARGTPPAVPSAAPGPTALASPTGHRPSAAQAMQAVQPRQSQPVLLKEELLVSVDAMPYLIDHCLLLQPADWPVMEDRWPVVPAATVMQLMMDAAERAVPRMRAVGVREARFSRWLGAAPAQTVSVTVRQAGPSAVSVVFGGYARAFVDLAADYPASSPAVWRPEPGTERPPTTSARGMYERRLLFHGPMFQGVEEIIGLTDRHVRGTLTVTWPPGALLDSGLQVFANWMVAVHPKRPLILPVRFGRIRFFGPQPEIGTECQSFVRTDHIDATEVVMSLQIAQEERVWLEAEQVLQRRFDTHQDVRTAHLVPERYAVSQKQPEGWVLASDFWTDPVSQGMTAFTVLGAAGAAEFDKVPVGMRLQWLLGRIAVKDAVRFRQWESGAAGIFPVELTVRNDASGRPWVTSRPGSGLIDCDVSLAHCREAAVAIARPWEPGADPDLPGVGIDIAEVTSHQETTVRYALADEEMRLLDTIAAGQRDLWFTRFWTAKEAVGKAQHTGLEGRPRQFTVRAADAAELVVTAAGRTYRVGFKDVQNPPDLPPRRYAVAWTWGPGTASDHC
jgi:acyl transferase domain-containing protein/phosphopantetheinyl transferase (holo-ACP synthase)